MMRLIAVIKSKKCSWVHYPLSSKFGVPSLFLPWYILGLFRAPSLGVSFAMGGILDLCQSMGTFIFAPIIFYCPDIACSCFVSFTCSSVLAPVGNCGQQPISIE